MPSNRRLSLTLLVLAVLGTLLALRFNAPVPLLLLPAILALLGFLLMSAPRAHAADAASNDEPPGDVPPVPSSIQPPRDASGEYQHLLERLGTLAQQVGTARDLATVFRALEQFIAASVPSNGLFISLYDAERQERTCVYAWSEGVEEDVSTLPPLPMTDSPNSRAVRTGQIIVTDDLDAALAGQPRVDVGLEIDPRLPRSSIAVPMAVHGRIIGAFEVQSVEPAAYTQEHVVTLRMAANLAAIAIENVQGFERERHLRVAAERSEQRFRDLVQGLDAVVWEADAATLRFTFVSQRAQEMLGYPVEQWLSEADFWRAHVHPDEREQVAVLWQGAATGEHEREFEYRAFAANGSTVWLRASIHPVRAADGTIWQLRGLLVNITKRKRAEEALRLLSEAGRVLSASLDYETTLGNLARLAVTALADYCLVIVLEDGRLRQVASAHINPEQEALTRELERRYPYEVDNPDSIVARVLHSQKTEWHNDLSGRPPHLLTQDEAVLEIYHALAPRAYVAVPLVARDRILGVVMLVSSVSGRQYTDVEIALAEELVRRAGLAVENARLYQQAQEAIQTRDQFISIASHDLKTPITSIKGYADLLARRAAQNEAINTRDQRAIQIIQDEATRLNRLVELLLDVSRFQRGQLVIERSQMDLCVLAQRLVTVVQAMAEQHVIELACPEEPVLLWGDALRLEQVIQNLLQNAVKYSPAGGHITVEIQEKGESIALAVADEGIGIPPEALAHLFTRFYRASNIQPLSVGGLGLGLYIVRHIAEAHGGTVSVTSELGVGSTFTVELPLDPRQEPR
jgi:PAS domain S-box-containing protein